MKTTVYTPFRLTRNQRRFAAAFMLACFVPTTAFSLPTAPQVISGTANIGTSGSAMTITNSANAIINWQSFSIGQNESTRFIQPSAASAVLNRVTGGDPSKILGALQSNGKVLLINPSGILFGQNARVDVNGLIASSLNITNDDFLAGKMKFSAGITAGKIENQGAITTPSGGQVYLIAPDVSNSGIITAPNGDVMLAAGKEVLLVDKNNPEIALVVSAPEGESLNLGTIAADAGRVGMYGSIVRQKGRISADSAVKDASGRIFLKATREATVEAGSTTSANGTAGGAVTVQASEGTALIGGRVEAKGYDGTGGTVQMLGQQVGMLGNAKVDVSGLKGGGSALIGGDYQGKNAAVQNARATYIGKDTAITADAAESGDGGKVIVWSDDTTRYFGTISAKGGITGGNGGVVEVSGKKNLSFSGNVDATAPKGRIGTLLLDPDNIIVATGGGAPYADVDNSADQPGTTQTIAPATLNGVGASVTLQATNDITFTDALNLTTASAGLTAQAGNNITVNNNISTNGGDITLTATAGSVSINKSLNSSNGNVVINSAGNITLNDGTATNIAAGTGNVTLNTTGGAIQGDPAGGVLDIAAANVQLNAATGISANGGSAQFSVNAGTVGFNNSGTELVRINNSRSGASSFTTSSTAGPLVLESSDSANPTSVGNITSTGGDIVLRINNLNISNPINAGANNVYLAPYTASSPVSLGGSETFDLTGSELSNITAGKVIVGYDTYGNYASTASIGSTAAVTITNSSNLGVTAQNITTGANALSLSGGGSLSLVADGMSLTGAINSGSAAVSITSLTPSQSITLGAGASGLGLTAAEIKTINGSGQLTIGSAAHTGTISTDGAFDLTGGTFAGSWTRLDTSGGAITLNHDVTVPFYLGLITTNNSNTTAAVTGTGMLTTGGGGSMTVDSGSGISLTNAGNLASNLVMINRGTGNIAFNNNSNLIINSTNLAAGGTTTIVNATGTMTTNSTGVTGSGSISLQTPGTLTVNSGNPIAASGASAVSLTSTGGAIVLNDNVSSGSGNITLSAGGTISGTGAISGSALSTSSVSGTTLSNSNTVTSYSGSNSVSGNITLNNTAATLTLNGSNIHNASGGDINISNTGAINTVGWIQTTGNGSISLTATGGTATIGNSLITGNDNSSTGSVSVTTTGATSDILLNNINVYSGSTGGGSGGITLNAGRNIALNPAELRTTGNLSLIAGGTINETGAGAIHGALLTTSSVGGTNLPNANTVTSFNATNSGSGDILLENTAAPLTVTGISQSGGGAVTVTNNGSITTSGAITLSGGMGLFTADGATSDITVDGAVTKTSGADSALSLLAQRNIVVNQPVSSTSNKLDVNLVSHYLSDIAVGSVWVNNDISTNGGNLVIGGGTNPLLIPAIGYDATTLGIAGERQYGVNLDKTAGTAVINTSGGNISIRGQGVANSSYDALGVYLGAAQLYAGGGNILLMGQAGDSSTSSSSGVQIANVIDTTGNGTITIQGTGGANTSATKTDRGVYLSAAAAVISTANGSLSITGTGGTNTTNPGNPNNIGVRISSATIQSTGGSVNVTGIPGSSGSKGFITSGAAVNITSPVAVNVKSDKMAFSATTETLGGAGSTVTLLPATAGRSIVLGSDTSDAGGDLELSTNELGKFTASILRIGDLSSGAISVDAAIAPASVTTLSLGSGSTVTQNGAGTISIDNLAVRSLGYTDLSTAANMVTNIAASLGDGSNLNRNFRLTNGGTNLNVGAGIDGLSGITMQRDGANYNTASQNSKITLITGGALTQSAGALLSGKAVYAKGSTVDLQQLNPTGVLAGEATGGSFAYKSSNGIFITQVNAMAGVQNTGTGGDITLTGNGISQYAPLSTGGAFRLSLISSGNVMLQNTGNNVANLSANLSGGAGSLSFYNSENLILDGPVTTNGNYINIEVPATKNITVNGTVSAGTGVNAGLRISGGGITYATGGVTNSEEISLRSTDPTQGIILSGGVLGTSNTKDIEIITDKLTLSGGTAMTGATAGNGISIAPSTANTAIVVGPVPGTPAANTLYITDTSTVTFSAPDFGIGSEVTDAYRVVSGAITVDTAISRPAGRVGLFTGAGVTQTAPITAAVLGVIAGGAVNLSGSNQVGSLGIETSTGAVDFANSTAFTIDTITGGYDDITTITGVKSVGGGSITLSSAAGNIGISAPISTLTGGVSITTAGAITDSSAGVAPNHVKAPAFTASTTAGIGSSTHPIKTAVSTLSAETSTSGDIAITNNTSAYPGALTVANLLGSSTGKIILENYGSTTTSGSIQAGNNITITAHSPLTIGSDGVTSTSGGNIVLTAGATGEGITTDNLTINGPVTTSGSIQLSAGNSILGSDVPAGGNVTKTANLNPAPSPPPLPTLADCTTNPTLSGCTAVLPTLATCTANPTAPGCTAVLPTVSTCTTTPTAPGCSAVLPTLDVCTANPTAAGCTAVLPSVATCTTTPTAPGCTAVLPTVSTCTATPTAPGCSAVLPTLDVCTANPTAAGCTAVLPSVATCTTTPTAPGCTAVLPTLSTCTTTPTAPGCTAVLPTVATCTTTPTAPGCTAVLPTLDACTTNPATQGCSAVLPALATCTTNPTAAGCTAVLPTIATCTTTPTAPGCTAVLPTLSTCTTTPTAPGCSAVLPTIATCTTTSTAPGCSAVLPTLDACITNPNAAGCSVVLPTLATCTTTPTAPGCTAVLPKVTDCTSNPSLPGCIVVMPVQEQKPVAQAVSQVVKDIEQTQTTPVAPAAGLMLISLAKTVDEPAPPAPPASQASTPASSSSSGEQTSPKSDTGSAKEQTTSTGKDAGEKEKDSGGKDKEDKKDKDKDKDSQEKTASGDKKDEKPKKNYCN